MEEQANKSRKPAPRYQAGDKVWLSARNLQTKRPSKKLDHKQIGPFQTEKQISPSAYELDLPASMKIHPVFHSSLLRLDPGDPLPGQIIEPQPPVVIDDEEEWEVSKILDLRYHYRRLQYRVEWTGHAPDTTWYDAANFDHAQETIAEFHRTFPEKPGVDDVIRPQLRLLSLFSSLSSLDGLSIVPYLICSACP